MTWPLYSKFDTTLYADDTALLISDSNILSLECKVNHELEKIKLWLQNNKLSLNCSKTNYMIFNKQPHKTCHFDLKLYINNISIQRVNSFKYLGVIFDDKLKWTDHIDYRSLKVTVS